MNTRTTLVLALLVAAGVGGWLAFEWLSPKPPDSPTVAALKSLDPAKLTRIEVRKGDRTLVALTRDGKTWQLPGNWPIREREVDDLLELVTSLSSRFEPIRLNDNKDEARKQLQAMGLVDGGIVLSVHGGERDYTLFLGEAEGDEKNRFARPTYLRLGQENEVLRLGPGIVAKLDRPQEFYQSRRLFPSERVAMDEKSSQKVEQILASAIQLAGPGLPPVALVKKADLWELTSPRDRVDPERIKTLLTRASDIWAEKFVEPEALARRFADRPAPLTGYPHKPALPKRDFLTTQALYAASQAALEGLGSAAAGVSNVPSVLCAAFQAAQALPLYSLKVTRPDGSALTLHVGEVSSSEKRKGMRSISIPGKRPIMVPEETTEELHYARVEDPRFGTSMSAMPLFEVKGETLKELPSELDRLRDAALFRFEIDAARRLEVQEPKGEKGEYLTTLLLTKVKEEKKEPAKKAKVDPFEPEDPFKKKEDEEAREVWRMEKPSMEKTERDALDDLLRQLSRLESSGDDAFYPDDADLGRFGLDRPAYKITLTYDEEDKKKDPLTGKKAKKQKTVVVHVGKGDPKKADAKKEKEGKVDSGDKGKTYVRVEGWPRVSAVEEKLMELVSRPSYVYRQRKLLELAEDEVGKLRITRGKEEFTLTNEKTAWKLTAPINAPADDGAVEPLLKQLGQVEAVEFVADRPTKEDADKLYGLAAPAAVVKIEPRDEKAATRVLLLGKQRPDRTDYYARLDDGPVFVMKKDVADSLLKDALAYRALGVWKLAPDEVIEVGFERKEGSYRLVRDGEKWKIAGPMEASASPEAEALPFEVASLRAARFVEHSAKELDKYGLKTPALKVQVKLKEKDAKGKTLWIGDKVEGGKERFALVEGEEGVFVLGARALQTLERSSYDWLDKLLLTLKDGDIKSIRVDAPNGFTLLRRSGEWVVTMSPAPEFTAEEPAVQTFLRPWRSLEAERIAERGSKIDWAKYGLDKPHATLTVGLALPEGKPIEHVLALGGDAGKGARYARMDRGEFVAVIDADVVRDLDRRHVDFLPLQVMKFTITDLTGLTRLKKDADVSLFKQGESWRLEKPYDRPADDVVVGEIIDRAFRLRAQRIVAYPPRDLAEFGLDKPVVVKFILTDPTGAPTEEKLLIGGPVRSEHASREPAKKRDLGDILEPKADDPPKADVQVMVQGEHYAMREKDNKVFVLSAELSRHFLARPLYFADRNLPTFARADQAVQERGKRRVVFGKAGSLWKMTGPVEAAAEDGELDNFVKEMTRLRAGELVAAKASEAELKKFGLDRPEATWTFRLGDKDVGKLLIGGVEDEKAKEPGRYARLEGSDVVFLLTPKMAKEALGEYRERKPWRVDAVGVEELRYESPTGPFRLAKRDTRWILFERPDDKVNSKAVTDTLDALADLKVVRFISDKEDREQEVLAGLQKAEYVIDVRSGKESSRLYIGRKEAGSERRYARSEGSPAIFVISEADAARLLRPLAAFVEGEKK